jgi:hypothetical protein
MAELHEAFQARTAYEQQLEQKYALLIDEMKQSSDSELDRLARRCQELSVSLKHHTHTHTHTHTQTTCTDVSSPNQIAALLYYLNMCLL